MKKAIISIIVVLLIASAAVIGFLKGADKVRDGLIANYPTVKNLVQGATAEFDSVFVINLTKQDNEELFNLLSAASSNDSLAISIPYYGRYGIDLSVRNFRVFRDGQTVQVWIPATRLLYCELKFDQMSLNSSSAVALFRKENSAVLKQKMYEFLIPILEKHKSNQKAAKTAVAKAMMFYFMPYKFDLQLYINEEQQQLPIVPGINQTVDEAINEMVGK